jgi:hypothetical protein
VAGTSKPRSMPICEKEKKHMSRKNDEKRMIKDVHKDAIALRFPFSVFHGWAIISNDMTENKTKTNSICVQKSL